MHGCDNKRQLQMISALFCGTLSHAKTLRNTAQDAEKLSITIIWGRFPQSAAWGLRGQSQYIVRSSREVVPSDASFLQIVSEHWYYAHGLDGFEIVDDLTGSLLCILGLHVVRRRCVVEQGIIENLALGVAIQGADMVRCGQSEAFIGLGHQVADINFCRLGLNNGL